MYVVGAVSDTVGGPVSSDQVYEAGVPSELPAASVARTSNVWLPSASAAVVCGLEHGAQLPASTRHSNVEPLSLELNPNVGVASLSSAGGCESMLVSGAVRSTVQVKLAGDASVLPAGAVGRGSEGWPASPRATVF